MFTKRQGGVWCRRSLRVLCAAGFAGCLAGCVSTGPRTYEYAIDLRNSTDETLSVELLKVESNEIRKVMVDLAPGASYSERFTTNGYGGDYVEARIAPTGSGPDPARQIVELKRGQTKYELERLGGRIVAKRPERESE